MKITVGNLKGGVGKTTTAVYLATALAADSARVLIVDADPQSQSAYDWAQLAISRGYDLPWTVYPWATDDLATRVRGILDQYDHVLIDTGGETPRLFRAACMVTDDLLIPVAPNEIEMRRLPASFAAAAEVDAMGHPVYPRILLTRVDNRTGDGPAARAFLAAQSPPLPVLGAHVRDAVLYSRAHGHVPTDLGDYAAVLAELRDQVPA